MGTRREFLGSSFGLLGALPFGRLLRSLEGSVAPPVRCVTLGANGVISPGSSQDYRSCRRFVLETGTRWVRLWADWPSLQPEAGLAPDAGSGAWRLRELDRQIAQANSDGVNVILTSYRFPGWANGTAGVAAQAEPLYQLEDRVAALGYSGAPKDLRFRVPADVGPGGDWAAWIEFLVERYADRIAALELVNEPNAQLWPLQGPSATGDPYDEGPVTVHQVVAQMFATARRIVDARAPNLMLMGPATSDTAAGSRLAIGYDVFTRLLLDELDRIGFEPGARFAWSQHNYADVESGSTLAATTRALLAGRWAGWPEADPSRPGLLLPEGGARLTKIAQLYSTQDPDEIRARQAELIARSAGRLARTEGVAMVGQYLFYSDPNFDSGLCEPDGTKRVAYRAWSALPT